MMDSLEEIMQKYKLPDKEHKKIGEGIINIMLYDKYPVERPKAIIDIAPPASGKTGLNSYGHEQFIDDNVVIINSDELKPFHPQINEIAKRYPQYYTKVTDQESNTWTSDLFDTALEKKYNVIFEGTGKNARILNTIKEKMQGYDVTVRGMAVNELNCLISILERYELQVKTKGWGRLVVLEHFYETYVGMLETIDTIEKSGIVDNVEIYKRGKKPSKPQIIYDSSKKKDNRFPNAKQAVIIGREEDRKNSIKYFNENIEFIKKLLKENGENEAVYKIVNKIMEIVKKKSNDKNSELIR